MSALAQSALSWVRRGRRSHAPDPNVPRNPSAGELRACPQARIPVAASVLEGGSSAGRALWRLPSRSGQPGIALDSARVGDLELRAASVIGTGHRCAEPAVVRQDAYAVAVDSARTHLVIAVADGVSSAVHADLGARIAVSTAAREMAAALDRGTEPEGIDARGLFMTVAGEIVGTGRDRGIAERDLCCLLVVAVVPTGPGPDGVRTVWTAQIGDVSVWTHGDRLLQQTGTLKGGLDRNAVDVVLPFHPDAVTTRTLSVRSGGGVAVVTDGVGDLLTDVGSGAGFFTEAWAVPPHPAGFLVDLCVDAPGQDDDRTAVVVWCGPDPGPPAGPR